MATATTVAGGGSNSASGFASTVPGGYGNVAGGDYSFAAGRRAKVRDAATVGDADGDQGTFLWSDANDFNFASTGPNQFGVRATGGVRFVTAIDGSGNPTKTMGLDSSATSACRGTWQWRARSRARAFPRAR